LDEQVVDEIRVPGAERQQQYHLDDLTTAGLLVTGHTDWNDWITLHASGTRNPTGVPGIQIDGYFPDTSGFNDYHGWHHDAQFVLRLPDAWNGKLVITGAPGVRRQYANDFTISDWVLSKGYAYASTDKGNNGPWFYRDGAIPGDAVLEWHQRAKELTLAAKEAVRCRYGREPERTYITGMSNGGYLVRWALEHDPELYDGGVEAAGNLFTPDGPNMFTYLPIALKHYPDYRDKGDEEAHQAMLRAGFAEGSEFLWDFYYQTYWDLTQRIYREEFDPEFDGELEAGVPFCRSGTPHCDADYDYLDRPPEVREAVRKVSLTGQIGKPLLTLHGTLDCLLPIAVVSDVYARMVQWAGRGDLHRYYVIEAATHVDSLHDRFPDKLRPMLPCYRAAFELLERWVEQGIEPPPSKRIPRSKGDVVNCCEL
jgi:hypothetical protein